MINTATHPLQSHEWAEFRRAWGNEVLETKYGIITLHKIPLFPYKIGMFIKGPKPTQKMLDYLKKLAKEKSLIFIKLEPSVAKISEEQTEFNKIVELLKKNSCLPGKTLFTPTTFWIDLTPPEEDILKSFNSKTRYNIRLAQRKGVVVEVVEDPTSSLSEGLRGASNSNKAFEIYLKLMRETVERQGFYAHTEKYHRLMWEYLHKRLVKQGEKPIAHLLTAIYKKEIITCWIVFVYKDFLYYPYGASSEKYKNVMANNLMMWEAIRYGKKLGLKTFDLWGREEGKGFTRFKEGYNPQVVEFLGTWDLITSQLYWIYRSAEFLRWQLLRVKSKFIKPKF